MNVKLGLHQLLAVGALSLVTAGVQAALPHTFAAGQPARADDVNANFEYLDGELNNRAQQWDPAVFRATTITRATFSRERSNTSDLSFDPCDRIVMDYSDPANLMWELSRSADAGICWREFYQHQSLPDGRIRETSITGYDPNSADGLTNPDSRLVYDTPDDSPLLWQLGVPHVFAATALSSQLDSDGITVLNQMRTTLFRSFEPLGVESVSVPLGTFDNCLKIQKLDRGYKSLRWYCPGIGLVKETRIYDAGTADIRELIATE